MILLIVEDNHKLHESTVSQIYPQPSGDQQHGGIKFCLFCNFDIHRHPIFD